MKKIIELLFQPFATTSLFWVMASIMSPLKEYNEGNVLWQIFGISVLLITILLGIIIAKENNK